MSEQYNSLLGPEALEACRSCPAAQFISAYTAPSQTNNPVNDKEEEKSDE